MLWFYRYEHDPRYLYFIDGMVKWTRHCLYDRAGMADLPWAVFSMGAANGGEFLLDYYYTFRDDPERGALAQEAWRLAETIVYRNSYPYLGDPVETDTLDPSFLLQAVNSAYWIGAVTWGEMGRVPEMWIRMYLETGDPLLKYLVRGCMEQYYIGTINSAGAYTENLLVFQGGGMSGGWGGNNFRWLAEPLGSAVMQVSVGPKAALAFCKGTRALDVADYAYAPRGNCRFRVVADRTQPDAPTGPFDIMLTSPHEGIAGKPVRINGETLAAERYVIGSDGVNALVRGVRGGDVVTVGEAPVTLAPKPRPDFGVRRAFHPATTAGGAKQIPRATQDQAQPNRSAGVPPATGTTPDWIQYDLRRVAQEPVDTLWSGPWGGLVPGPKVMAGVAATFLEPAALGGRGAMSLRKPLTLTVTGAGPHVLFLGMPRPPKPVFGGAVVARCIVRNADGTSQTVTLNYEDGFEVRRGMEWYDKSWWIRAYPIGDARQNVAPASRRQQATRLTVTGSALLFAVSSPRSARARAAALAMRASTETRKRRQAYAQVQMPTRAATTSVAWTSRLPYRFLIRLSFASEPRAAGERSVRIVRVRQDLRALLAQVGIKAEPDPTSLEACLVGRGTAKPQAVACQLCPDDPSEPARGDLLLRLPPGAGSERLVAVYFGSGTRKAERPQAKIGPAYEYRREGSKAILSNGRLRMVFELSGIGAGPRMTEIGPEGGPNWLGPTGHDAGYAHLCACQDGVTWYDFGALQDTDATAEIVDSGPLATTVRFGNLRIYGEGPGVPFAGVGTRGERRASVKGVAEWYVRLYAGEPRADNWVSYTITDPSTAWTRPMEVRYAPAEPTKGRAGGTMGEPGAWARQGPLAMVALDLRPDRAQVAPYYTEEDGNLIGVRIAKAEAIGRFVSDVWRIVPASLSADALVAEADAVGVEQFAIERRSGQSAIRRKPVAVPLAEDDADRWSQRVAGEIVASIEAGSPDREDGIANNDNADEGTSARTRVGHIWCIAPGTTPSGQAQQFTYFDIEPEAAARVRGRTVFIAIEYLDLGRATVELHYDSGDPAVTRSAVPGAFKDASGMLRLGATGKRKTHVFSAPDPRFEDNCNGADFRLSVTGGPFHITRVALLIPSH